jgi:hypothetical protein
MSKDKATALIEKFSLSIVGEDPALVVVVLAAFVREICDRYEVPLKDFMHTVATMSLVTPEKKN